MFSLLAGIFLDRKYQRLLIPAIFVFSMFFFSGCSSVFKAPTSPDQSITSDGYSIVSDTLSGISFKWKVEVPYIYCVVFAPVTGWVAVGFGTNIGRAGADIYIGYVSGGVLFFDETKGFGNTKTLPHAVNRSGTEINGITEIKFTIPLDPGDPAHTIPLVQGRLYNLLLGSGTADDFAVQQISITVVTNKTLVL